MKNKRYIFTTILLFLCVTMMSITVYAKIYSDVVYKKENNKMKIALTFDDGPHPIYTEQILDILDKYNVKATFFLLGQNAKSYPWLVEREIKSGHEIGNHTFTHGHLSEMSSEEIITEINKCEELIYEICEYHTKLFRPPEGVLPIAIRRYAREDDYTVVLWSIDTYDWARENVDAIKNNILSNITPGDIILMHDYVPESITPQALEIIIPLLLDEGYEFVTISELIGS